MFFLFGFVFDLHYICSVNLKKKGISMTTVLLLSDGIQYTIPNSDVAFFKAIASKMGWIASRVSSVVTPVKETSNTKEIIDDAYALSKLKGRFAPLNINRAQLRDDYLLDKYGL